MQVTPPRVPRIHDDPEEFIAAIAGDPGAMPDRSRPLLSTGAR